VRCAQCGADNEPGGKFCEACGAALAAVCPTCGQLTRPDARFCRNCGTALGTDVAAATEVTPATASPSSATAERRLVTVLFTDLVGFTTLAEDRDPEAVRELLSRYFDTATEIVRVHGGTVEKFIGDAVMAVWGTPIAHEDDAERAVRAALELVDQVAALNPGLQARAGVLTGEAAVTIGATNQGMVAGDLVNTAARLQGVAEPGTVLVGEATMHAASSAVVFEPLGDHSLKGKTAPVPAWRAMRVVAQRGGTRRADTLEAPFVGRDEELRQLKEQLHAVGRDRRVRLVSITGPGGIGKSRLVWELEKYIDGVAEDIFWHRGRSPSYGEGIAFWALGEMIRRRAGLSEDDDEATTRERIAETLTEYVDDAADRETIAPALLSLLGVEAAPAGGRETLFPAWRLFFEHIARQGTTVLAFEDLQWADTGLLDFIDHLLDWSRGLPIMVITLARPELFDRRPDWESGRRSLTSMALDPLTDAAMRELLDGLVPGLPEAAIAAIVSRADGIPLYAVETVRALLADGRIERVDDAYRPTGDLSRLSVPDSLRSLIASRLDALEPVDRDLLQSAAVLGQVFAADALAAVSGMELNALEGRLRDLVRREILDIERDPASPERGMYKFVQSLIREVAYGTLARRDRRSRHLAAARTFEAIGDDELAGALAGHYLAAHAASDEGPEADAIAAQARLALGAAADRATALGGHDQAVAYLEQALSITNQAHERATLLDRAARAAVAAARPTAVAYAEAAVEAYRELGETSPAIGAAARLGTVLVESGELSRAIDVFDRTIGEAELSGDEVALADVLARAGRAYFRVGRHRDAIVAADRALEIAEPRNLEGIIADALAAKAPALTNLGRWHEAIAIQRAVVELAERLGNRSLESRALNNLAAIVYEMDPAEGSRIGQRSLELVRKNGDRPGYNWMVGLMSGDLHLRGERWDAQLALIDETLEATPLPMDRGRMLAGRALISLARGERSDEVIPELLDAFGETDDPEVRGIIAHTIGYRALLGGDYDEAFRRGMEEAGLQPQDRTGALQLAWAAAMAARDAGRVAEVAEAIGPPRAGPPHETIRGLVAAGAAALDGRRDEAVAGFRRAIEGLRSWGWRFYAAEVVVDAVVALPDSPDVRSWAPEARTLLEELRAAPYLARLDAALAAAPASRSGREASSPTSVPAP
jgi:class 3 adenylate cyclase/tetratricopeptide (TPR) repeat protein